MKIKNSIKSTLAAIAAGLVLTSSAFAASTDFPAPLPGFKSDSELAEWRNDLIAKAEAEEAAAIAARETSQFFYTGKPFEAAAIAARETSQFFYTGKPFVEETGEYAFLFRNYNPEIARWSSEDPSGFPDGANNLAYMAIPTTQFDWQGLESIDFNIKITLYQRKHGGQLTPFTGSTASLSETRMFYLEVRSDPYTTAGKEWMHEQWKSDENRNRNSPYMTIDYRDKDGMEVMPSLAGYMWAKDGLDVGSGGWYLQEGFPMYLNNNIEFIGGEIRMKIHYQNEYVYNHTVNITE